MVIVQRLQTAIASRLEDVTSVSEEFSHEVYEGRPETPYETEKFVLPALKIFGELEASYQRLWHACEREWTLL